MAKKNKPLNASTARVRVAPKKRVAQAKRAAKNGSRTKRSVKKAWPANKGYDAMKWCGVLPELAGDSLTIQRRMRDEW